MAKSIGLKLAKTVLVELKAGDIVTLVTKKVRYVLKIIDPVEGKVEISSDGSLKGPVIMKIVGSIDPLTHKVKYNQIFSGSWLILDRYLIVNIQRIYLNGEFFSGKKEPITP